MEWWVGFPGVLHSKGKEAPGWSHRPLIVAWVSHEGCHRQIVRWMRVHLAVGMSKPWGSSVGMV